MLKTCIVIVVVVVFVIMVDCVLLTELALWLKGYSMSVLLRSTEKKARANKNWGRPEHS